MPSNYRLTHEINPAPVMSGGKTRRCQHRKPRYAEVSGWGNSTPAWRCEERATKQLKFTYNNDWAKSTHFVRIEACDEHATQFPTIIAYAEELVAEGVAL